MLKLVSAYSPRCLAPSRAATFAATFLASVAAIVLNGCGAGNFMQSVAAPAASTVKLEGFVHGGQQPITGASVQLYAAGSSGDQSAATPLIAAAPLTDSNGAFSITGLYTCPSITTEVYLIARGGNPGLSPGTNNAASILMAALGPCGNLTSATHIIINEVTTVGSIYPITQFLSSYTNVGSSGGDAATLAADFMQINQFIDTNGGQSPGPQLPGNFTAPVSNLNSLANSVSACVNSAGGVAGDGSACGNLFLYATPPASAAPTDTVGAVLDIANNPYQNVNNIFLLGVPSPPFQPVLSAAPANWTLQILPDIILTTPSTLVGIGSATSGTVTLAQAAPAGGLVVNLDSSNTAAVTVTTPVNFAAGATVASFNYQGVAAGASTITASATGYASGTTTLTATGSLISLGTIPTVAPGQSVSLPLSIGTPAPAGGLTVNFVSANPAVATVTPSVFIPAGLQVPAANPQVTGVAIGNTVINANAAAYAPGARAVTVSVTASLPSTFSVPVGLPTNETLTISAPAPTGGITFNLSVDTPADFTVPSTVTVPAGATTVSIPIDGLVAGTTTNLRADSAGIAEAVSAVTVNGTINVQLSSLTTGQQLETSSYVYLATAPPTPTAVTFTSSNPAVFTVSTGPTVLGTASTSYPAVTSTGALTYYVQGTGVGTGTLTISAPGYSNSTVAITVDPSGFVFTTSSFSTTTLSSASAVTVEAAVLSPGTLAVLAYNALSPAANVNVAVASSATGIGTVTTPAAFVAGASYESVTFTSVGAGTTNLTLTTPAGFSTPSTAGTQQIVATVTAPQINAQLGSLTTGVGLENSTYVYLSQTPLVPTTVSIASANPAVAVVSTSPTVAGAGVANFTSVVNTAGLTFYVQGVGTGSTTLTASATPYTSVTINITVDPSGFILSTGSFSTTSLSSPSTLNAQPVILNPGTLTVLSGSTVAPQAAPVNLPVSSATTTVGTISGSPIVFTAGSSSASASFQPVGAGTSVVSIGTPAGFSTPTPASTQQLTATVTAPPINAQLGSLTTGVMLQSSTYVYLSQTPLTPVTVTIASSAPAVATVSTTATAAGAASTTFPNTVNTGGLTFYVQGQSVGTAVITASAPGYASVTMNVTVDPSGFVFSTSSFSTTTFSSASNIYVQPVILNPGTLTVLQGGTLAAGIGSATVNLSSATPQVGTITTPIIFTANGSSLYATFQPIAAGTTNLSISTPAGFSTPSPASTQQITATVTAPSIAVQLSSVTTGTNLELSTYAYLTVAPPSPVTVTVTSAGAAIATLSTSATVAGTGTVTYNNVSNGTGLTFYVQGHAVGTTTLTVSAPGYSSNTINVTVDPSGFIFTTGSFSTTTFSGASNVYAEPVVLTPGTLTVVSGGQLAPGAGVTNLAIASSVPGVGTISTPIVFNVGDTSDYATFTPVSAGTTNLSIATPAGFSTPSSASTQQITATITAPPVAVQLGSINTGVGLQVNTYAYLTQTPPSAVTVTMTINNPGVALLSKTSGAVGSASLSFTGVTNGAGLTFYIQGQTVGTATITVSAPGFTSNTISVASDPAGFVFSTGNFSTTTFSGTNNVYVEPVILAPGVLTVVSGAQIGPGGSISVPIASSVPGVGTITTPITFNVGDTSDYAVFSPGAAGSTVLSISTPAGFTTPSQSSTQQITATVAAPPIAVQLGSMTTGVNLQVSSYAYLTENPPSPETVTITSANPSVATISTSSSVVGTASVSYPSISSGVGLTFYLQGQTAGTTTLTVSAPGFVSAIINITVDPSGFVITSPGSISATHGGATSTVTFEPAILNAGVLTVEGYGAINPGIGTISLSIGSTSPQIGTIAPTTVSFPTYSTSGTATFTPLATGTTDIDIISQPTGFTTPSQPSTQQIVATVQ